MNDSSNEDHDAWHKYILKTIERLRTYVDITKSKSLLRRYFVMNAFDGTMTSLGIIIGAYISHISHPEVIVSVKIVGGIAMAISGFTGTYMTESAERANTLNELEDSMLTDLFDSIHGDASRYMSFFAALIDGSAPFLASLPSLLPFILSIFGFIPVYFAYFASVMIDLTILFLLGVFLGRISKRNAVYSGLKMIIAGIIVAGLALLIHGGFEA
ncbi:hypothetical protein KEJ21_01760 [Candidatus Bathyarchaeota archaeon]|nr:hypothetical protein [Candidatus Bathyarchaeota archaeon]MBS7630389.1 hypothetical protein [Candidatus Bathyarchaeota archaeon]